MQAEAESEDSQKELKKNPDWKKVWEMPHTTCLHCLLSFEVLYEKVVKKRTLSQKHSLRLDLFIIL